jgi:hypothetical protein
MRTRRTVLLTVILTIALTGYASASTVTGCLSGPNGKGVYDLTSKQQGHKIHVGGNPDLPVTLVIR